MKLLKYFFEKLLLPFLLSSPFITLVLSKVNTGQWTNYFKAISKREWLILIAMLVFLVIARWFILKVKAVRKRNSSGLGFAALRIPLYGWKEIGTLEYKNVLWKAKIAIDSSRVTSESVTPDDVTVDTPPRCPKCKTEIEEQHVLIGGYLWKCINCSFKKRNKDSYYTEANRAEKIAKRKVEEELERKFN